MDIPFPLLYLPDGAVFDILTMLDIIQNVVLSLLSERMKNLLTSFQMRADKLAVVVSDVFNVNVVFPNKYELIFGLYAVEEGAPKQKIQLSEIFTVDGTEIWQNSKRMSAIEFINHMKTLFHLENVMLQLNIGADRYDLESIFETVKNVDRIALCNENLEFNQQVLDFYKPIEVHLNEEALQNSRVPGGILIQNFEKLHVIAPLIQLSLDDLLLINSREVLMNNVSLTGKDLNCFLKLWLKGSNPKIENLHLQLSTGDPSQIEATLEGLKHQEFPSNEMRYLRESRGEMRPIPGGRDIFRYDGTGATLYVALWQNLVLLEMFVWNRHCFSVEADVDNEDGRRN